MIKVRWDINQNVSENNTDTKFFHSDDLDDIFRLYVSPCLCKPKRSLVPRDDSEGNSIFK